MINRRTFSQSIGASLALSALPSGARGQTTPQNSSMAKSALAIREWRDRILAPQLRLRATMYWYENAQFAEEIFHATLADMEERLIGEHYGLVRMLAQGEFNTPAASGTPRFDSYGIRTAVKDENANGVFVLSLCGNLLSAHYTLVVRSNGSWESPADDLIYQILSRMDTFDGDVSRDSLMALLPTEEEASEHGMPSLKSESFEQQFFERS